MVRALCGHALLVQANCDGLELLECVGVVANQVHLDFRFEASVEGGGKDLLVSEFHLEDYLLEGFSVLVDGAGLLDSDMESVLGLLLQVQVSPLELELILEQPPGEEVVQDVI